MERPISVIRLDVSLSLGGNLFIFVRSEFRSGHSWWGALYDMLASLSEGVEWREHSDNDGWFARRVLSEEQLGRLKGQIDTAPAIVLDNHQALRKARQLLNAGSGAAVAFFSPVPRSHDDSF